MVKSDATSVDQYLNDLPDDRKRVLKQIRRTILKNLNPDFEETMNWGMISYEIPLEIYPDTYNGQPLQFAALASQKQYVSLYLMSVYQDSRLKEFLLDGFKKIGKRPNIGKSCIRFKQIEDIPLEEIGKIISKTSVDEYIEKYEKARNSRINT